MKRTKIMNPVHPQWSEFAELMKYPTRRVPVEMNRNGQVVCKHDFQVTEKVLKTFPDVNIKGSLDYFKSFDIRCDCGLGILIGYPMLEDPAQSLELYKLCRIVNAAINQLFELIGQKGRSAEFIRDFVSQVTERVIEGNFKRMEEQV